MTSLNDLSERASKAVHEAAELARDMGYGFVGSEHLLWSLARSDGAVSRVLNNVGLNDSLIKDLIKKYGKAERTGGSGFTIAMSIAAECERVFELAGAQAKKLHHESIEPEHLLLGIINEKGCAAAQLISSTGVNTEHITADLFKRMGKEWPNGNTGKKDKKTNKSKALEQFSIDLTARAREGKLDPVIGRDIEIARIIQILSRRTKNNPVLIGEPGVGKTALAEGLAQRIVSGDVPETLAGVQLLIMDLGKMVSGTRFRGDFEERIKNYIEEAGQTTGVILFIDELHTLIGAGGAEGSLDAANVFKPVLSRGGIQVIGATTLKEYKRHIEKDAALERRFQPVTVNEPSREDTIKILCGLRERYEKYHMLAISDEAITAAVELSSRYIQDRFLPDKAIDLIDEAASHIRTRILSMPPYLKELNEKIQELGTEKNEAVAKQDFEKAAALRDQQDELGRVLSMQRESLAEKQGRIVKPEDIAHVVSMWTGIPVTLLNQSERERLRNFENILHKRVVGQDEAITAMAKAIRRSRVGIKQKNRPIGSFIFLGPTGVGKTEVCRALAEAMFQDENAIIRMDMSEFMERHTVAKLIGSPPGYVGYDEGGQLTERVRRKPYSIILFDEIEKAHPDVWNMLLQIMEDGRLTDGQGRTVDFKNTVIVMTSNLGSREITGRTALGFAKAEENGHGVHPAKELHGKVMDEMKRTFQPEFINRVDEIIVFHQLTKEQIRDIAYKMLDELKERSAEAGIVLTVEDSAVDILAERGFDPKYGARPLRRTISSSIEDMIAEAILEDDDTEAVSMTIYGENDELRFDVKRQPCVTQPALVEEPVLS